MESYIQGCGFHDGFSPAIGIFGTDGLTVDDNVIHFTVGEGGCFYLSDALQSKISVDIDDRKWNSFFFFFSHFVPTV